MRLSGLGPSLFMAVGVTVVTLTAAAVWLFLTDPVTVATALNEGEISPFVRDLANVLLEALKGILKYL
jgi:hypothetical protein